MLLVTSTLTIGPFANNKLKKKECIGYRYEICGDHSLKELKKKKKR